MSRQNTNSSGLLSPLRGSAVPDLYGRSVKPNIPQTIAPLAEAAIASTRSSTTQDSMPLVSDTAPSTSSDSITDSDQASESLRRSRLVTHQGIWKRPQLTRSVAERCPSPGVFPGDMRLPRDEYREWLWLYLSDKDQNAVISLYDDFKRYIPKHNDTSIEKINKQGKRFTISNQVMEILVRTEYEVVATLTHRKKPAIVGLPRDPDSQLRRLSSHSSCPRFSSMHNCGEYQREYHVERYPVRESDYRIHWQEWSDFIYAKKGGGAGWDDILDSICDRLHDCKTTVLAYHFNYTATVSILQYEGTPEGEPFKIHARQVNHACKHLFRRLEWEARGARHICITEPKQPIITQRMFDGLITRVEACFDEFDDDIDDALNALMMDPHTTEIMYKVYEAHSKQHVCPYREWRDIMGACFPRRDGTRAVIPRLA